MPTIRMTLIEDAEAGWSELDATEPKAIDGLIFDWHPSFEERITRRIEFEKFKTFLSGEEVEGWGIMSGQWIVFTDLGLGVVLTPKEAADLASWVESLGPSFQIPVAAAPGLYLAGLAMQAAAWDGLIVISSGLNPGSLIKARLKLQEIFGRTGKVLILGQGNFPDTPEMGLAFGREQFARLFPDQIENRIWPDSTLGWFDDDLPNQVVPHDPPTFGKLEWAVCKSAFHSYLSTLFRFSPEENWLSEQQLPFLHHAIKGLVGACSDVQGPRDKASRLRVGTSRYRLTLGGAVLLLAAAEGAPRDWMAQFKWDRKPLQILPEQTSTQAEAAVTAMFKFFQTIAPKIVATPILQEAELEIEVGFSSTDVPPENPTRGSLITRILEMRNPDGKTFTAYGDFFVAAAAAQHQGREARCVVNVLPCGENKSLIQVVSCR